MMRKRRALPAKSLSLHKPTYGLPRDKLCFALSEFGPLPAVGRENLIGCLVEAFNRHQFRARTVERISIGRQRDLLKRVEKSTKALLLKLGVKTAEIAPRTLWDAALGRPSDYQLRALGKQNLDGQAIMLWLSQIGIDKKTDDVNAKLGENVETLARSIIGLLELHRRARLAAEEAARRTTSKRGGARHGPQLEGLLIRHTIAIYADLRSQYPGSGPEPGFGGPLLRFVRAVGSMCNVELRDSAVRDGLRYWKSKAK
jgi:hypothetical protein